MNHGDILNKIDELSPNSPQQQLDQQQSNLSPNQSGNESVQQQTNVVPPPNPIQVLKDRVRKVRNSPKVCEQLEQRLDKMVDLLNNGDQNQKAVATSFVNRTVELFDKLRDHQEKKDKRWRDKIKSWENSPATSSQHYTRSKINNQRHRSDFNTYMRVEEALQEVIDKV